MAMAGSNEAVETAVSVAKDLLPHGDGEIYWYKKINFPKPSKLLACIYTPSAPYADRQSSATVLEPSSDNAEGTIAGHWHAVVLTYSLMC